LKTNKKKRYTILVVDDEELIRETLTMLFEMDGFRVQTANNGMSALKEVRSHKFDLILTDMRMPEGDGMFLLEQLRTHIDEVPPVVMITGFADYHDREIVAKGARQVIHKPLNFSSLLESVYTILDSEVA
jgi:CheY-like chemotaxis protein